MSGETEDAVSGWTVDTLKAHLEQQLNDFRLMMLERYETQTKAVDAAFLAQQTAMQTALTAAERAVATALLSAEKAVEKANTASEKRFDAVNEFRQQQTDLLNRFMPRTETEQRIKQVDDKIEASAHVRAEAVAVINSRLDVLTGKSSGSAAVIGYIFGAAAAGAAVAAIIAVIVK